MFHLSTTLGVYWGLKGESIETCARAHVSVFANGKNEEETGPWAGDPEADHLGPGAAGEGQERGAGVHHRESTTGTGGAGDDGLC